MAAFTRAQINWLADTVRKSCELTLPVDTDMAVSRLRGELVLDPSADYEAKIEKTQDGFRISLGIEPTEERRRFSVAHELGHLFLHMGYLIDEKRWKATPEYMDSVYYRFGFSVEESEANEFAGAFLMPAEEFRSIVARHSASGRCDVAAVAEYFRTSDQATLVRGRFLGLFPWD
jgi:hypothetical protein